MKLVGLWKSLSACTTIASLLDVWLLLSHHYVILCRIDGLTYSHILWVINKGTRVNLPLWVYHVWHLLLVLIQIWVLVTIGLVVWERIAVRGCNLRNLLLFRRISERIREPYSLALLLVWIHIKVPIHVRLVKMNIQSWSSQPKPILTFLMILIFQYK